MSQFIDRVFIDNIKVTNYRNFSTKSLNFSKNIVFFHGANGVGKTNILEAISLLAPSKGIRNSKLDEIESCNNNAYLGGWSVKANFSYINKNAIDLSDVKHKEYNFITAKEAEQKNRHIYVNDNKLTKQQDLTKFLNIIWLTPIHDTIFIDAKSQRSKFFDRLVFNIFPDHIQNLAKYDYYIKERLTILLSSNNYDNLWLNNIENEIALLISSITHARVQTIKYLNAELENLSNNYPKSFISFIGEYEELYINSNIAKDVENTAKEKLSQQRAIDKEKAQTTSGIHKTDFHTIAAKNHIAAKLCSTGEQKSLLISIIIAKARILKKYNNKTPILLLDEITSHLDHHNAQALLDEITDLDIQCFMTGTNHALIEQRHNAQIINF